MIKRIAVLESSHSLARLQTLPDHHSVAGTCSALELLAVAEVDSIQAGPKPLVLAVLEEV